MDCADEDVVSYGTPLATEEDEDEAPRKKPVPIEQQEVRDERGLRRFHGAFTGGFSAGYFNTVGTKEGWTPATFLSSRAERAGKQSQRPEDFMDTEDLGVFGIAPRAIQVNKEFAEDEKGVKGARKRQFVFNEGPIPGLPPLKDLIVPSSESAGVKLLRRMGWKPGQGIGPRVKTKKKRKIKNITVTKEPENLGVKVYGCFLPKNVSLDEDSEDEELLRGITFAPDDVEVMSYKAKDDFHGIGYTGLDRNPILATFRSGKTAIAPPPVRDKKKKLAITGEAFGVGVYEEDDENIYCVDDMSQYDFELGASTSSKKADGDKVAKGVCDLEKPSLTLIDQLIQRVNLKIKAEAGDRRKGVGHVSVILEGFHISAQASSRKKRYPPPQLAKNFQPLRRKSDVVSDGAAKHEMTVLDRHRMTATERAEIVGTEKQKGSVFDLLRPEDKERLMAMTNKNHPSTATSVSSSSTNAATLATPSTSLFTSKSRKGVSGFQPFANEENKQKRYDLYLKFKDDNKEDAVFHKFQPAVMTEWEKQREMEEFRLASAIYKPLAHSMALRFVTAKQTDVDVELKTAAATAAAAASKESKSVSNENLAAVVLDYGKATRTKVEWHPDRLLCRRFNIPNPYPESTLVGILKVKRERFTLFNMFGVADEKTTFGDELLSIELPKETEELSAISRKDSAETSATTTKAERPNLFANLDDIETMPNRVSEKSKEEDLNANDEDSKKDETSRPPLDLFKAIFQNTDSEAENSSSSSSEDEKNEGDAKNPDPAKQEAVASAAVQAISVADAISNHSATMRAYAPAARAATTGLFSNLDFDDLDRTSVAPDNGQKRLASVAVRVPPVDADSNYGPALPPHLSQSTANVVASDVDRSKRKDKKSHKSKHKHKRKSKAKSKHRSGKNRSDPEFSSASDTELNRLIKTRLKKCKSTGVM